MLTRELLSNLLGVYEAVPPMKETRKVHLGGQFPNVRTGQRAPQLAWGAITIAAFCPRARGERHELASGRPGVEPSPPGPEQQRSVLLGCHVQREYSRAAGAGASPSLEPPGR